MLDYYTGVLKNYAGFEGRARRAEFWQFFLVNVIIYVVLAIVSAVIGFIYLAYLYDLAVLVPSLAVGARRLHDTGKSGWLQLIGIVPILGAIVLIVFWAQEGIQGPNNYGADPKNPAAGAPADVRY